MAEHGDDCPVCAVQQRPASLDMRVSMKRLRERARRELLEEARANGYLEDGDGESAEG